MPPIFTKRKLMKFYLIAAFLLFTFSSFSQFKDGNYRWLIHRSDSENIVFTTMVFSDNRHKNMFVINGADSMLVDDIRIKGDSLFIELPFFESSFEGKILSNGNLSGDWVKKSAGKVVRRMPFEAIYGENIRFYQSKESRFNIEGQWKTTFTSDDGKKSDAIGEFWQQGNHLTGTFRTPYGDYRFLEGIVNGDSLFLSGFDGSYAILFKGKILGDGGTGNQGKQISGAMFSGNAPPRKWESSKSIDNSLVLEEKPTRVKAGENKMHFRFPNTEGEIISIDDPRYKNKVVVVQIMGSWCPNCVDEMKFIMENYDRYKKMGVEFIALAYERTDNFEESKRALEPFLNRFKVPYEVLIVPVAVSDEERAQKSLPQIEEISAFPTTIFLDKEGNIAKIHTGFDGPATGIHYEKYKEEFEKTIKELLRQ